MAASKKEKNSVEQPAEPKFFLASGNFWTHTLMRLLIAALVVSGGLLALAMARDKAVQISDFQVSPASLQFISKPDWLKGPIEQQLKNFGWGDRKISLLDGQATRKVAAALSANPMVKKVRSVERQFPNSMRASVELREPAAYVMRGSKYYIIDVEGTRLPGEYPSRAAAGLDLLMVAYVRTSPPVAGKVWEDRAVVELSLIHI